MAFFPISAQSSTSIVLDCVFYFFVVTYLLRLYNERLVVSSPCCATMVVESTLCKLVAVGCI